MCRPRGGDPAHAGQLRVTKKYTRSSQQGWVSPWSLVEREGVPVNATNLVLELP